jgi:hypothetical protein
MSDTRETLKQFLNKNTSTQGKNSISLSHNKSPGDNIRLDNKEDIEIDPVTGQKLLDLETPGKGMLGDYLNFLTKESDHVFPIKEGNENAPQSNRGDYLATSSEHGAEKIFLVSGTENSNNFTRYSNSQFQELHDIIDKIGFENDANKGHKVLSNIEGTGLSSYGEISNELGVSYRSGDQNPVTQAVQNDVLVNSRFGNIPGKDVFKGKNETSEIFENKENIKINNTFGKYSDINVDSIIKLEKLKHLGASLLMKTSGFDTGINPGQSSNPEDIDDSFSNNGENSAGAGSVLLTSTEIKVNNSLFRSKNAFGAPKSEGTDESLRAGRGEFLEDDRQSYGSTYNAAFHFNGKNHKMHKLQAALAITLVKELGKELYNNIIQEYVTSEAATSISHEIQSSVTNQMQILMGYSSQTQNFEDNISTMAEGLTNLRLQSLASQLFTPTRYAYSSCINRGLKVLFDDSIGLEQTIGSLGSLSPNSVPEIKNIRNSIGIGSSPGYWLSIAKSVLKSSKDMLNSLDLLTQSEEGVDRIQNFIEYLNTNSVIRFLNVLATVGDASFQAFSGESLENIHYINRPRNVDSFPDGPGTRVGKSKKKDGYTDKQLAWSQNDVPSIYLLPLNPLRASGRLDKIISGPNPFTAMLGSRLADQTYFSKNMDGSNNRIPKEVVKRLENILDSEYVPFYFHDLRTNEIIAFHAFLNSLTDTINPNFNAHSGYGRLDPVRLYEGTTRSISVGFTVVSTSKEDFDAMWYKINKFVTLLYPQWTKGTLVGYDLEGDTTSKFIQPNSQVLGASPIVRMRVGDIIKSNYSKFNLARMFGIGDSDVNPIIASDAESEVSRSLANYVNSNKNDLLNKVKDVSISLISLIYGSPVQAFNFGAAKDFAEKSNGQNKLVKAGAEILTYMFVNGHVNPLILKTAIKRQNKKIKEERESAFHGPNEGFTMYLRSNYNEGYEITNGSMRGKRFLIQKPIKVKLNKKNPMSSYEVEIVDFSLPTEMLNVKLRVNPVDVFQTPNETLINTLEFGILLAGTGGFIAPGADALLTSFAKGFANQNNIAPLGDLVRHLYTSNESNFMDSFNNPFVKAYESTAGRGLAGTIGSVTFDWLDDKFTWDIDHNSRAPIGCNISFTFDVIHDIAPGLDHSGYNRAPLYNVGDVMRGVSGDTYESFFKEDEFEFRKSSGKSSRVPGKDTN